MSKTNTRSARHHGCKQDTPYADLVVDNSLGMTQDRGSELANGDIRSCFDLIEVVMDKRIDTCCGPSTPIAGHGISPRYFYTVFLFHGVPILHDCIT
jgi:hypothetical protein